MTRPLLKSRSLMCIDFILTGLLATALAGCSEIKQGIELTKYSPSADKGITMSVDQARNVVKACCSGLFVASGALAHKFIAPDYDVPGKTMKYMFKGNQPFDTTISGVTILGHRLIVQGADGNPVTAIRLADSNPRIYAGTDGFLHIFPYLALSDSIMVGPFGSRPEDDAHTKAILQAVTVLRTDAVSGQDERQFEDVVFSYQSANPKPTLPEEARRFAVQAEGAVKDRNFDEAEEYYGEALKIAPWWPDGHFNRAEILAGTGDYETAITEMNRYLRLAPDAPDARAAQDKIYDWERKSKEVQAGSLPGTSTTSPPPQKRHLN